MIEPAIFIEATRLSRALNRRRMALTQKASALDIAIWNVRSASTGLPKAAAASVLKQLLAHLAENEHESETV